MAGQQIAGGSVYATEVKPEGSREFNGGQPTFVGDTANGEDLILQFQPVGHIKPQARQSAAEETLVAERPSHWDPNVLIGTYERTSSQIVQIKSPNKEVDTETVDRHVVSFAGPGR